MKLLKPQDYNKVPIRHAVYFYDTKVMLSRQLSRAIRGWSYLAFYIDPNGRLIARNDADGFKISWTGDDQAVIYRMSFCEDIKARFGFKKHNTKCIARLEGDTIKIKTTEL